MISDFDFTITKFAYYKNYDNVDEDNYLAVYEVAFQEEFFEHLHTKRLVIDDDLPYPVSTFNRIMKYAKYGYQLMMVKILKKNLEKVFMKEWIKRR